MGAAQPELSPAATAFLAMLSAERGVAANTLLAYGRDLAGAEDLAGDLARAPRARIAKLGSAWGDLAPATIARKASALRQFFHFACEEGWRGDDPSGALPQPRTRRPLPRILGHQAIDDLLSLAETEAESGRPAPVRNLALIEMLYGSGLRASELVALPLTAVPRDVPLITVKGKGGQTRIVPISERAGEALARWIAVRPGEPPSRYLFPTRGGTGAGHLSRVRLFQLVRELAARAGLDPTGVSPHVLRHAFATHLLEGGADLRMLQTLLGHADITTTQIYTHVEAAKLVALVNARHPLARASATD
ncbi:MAG: tyrosine recombinase [Erythrobacter sp.]|nr:tyrosine recombinase [Erythrobacter sp.]